MRMIFALVASRGTWGLHFQLYLKPQSAFEKERSQIFVLIYVK